MKLHYDEYGNREKPTILLLHGAGALDTFCQQYCFAGKYHLVVPHLPGAGDAATEIYAPERTVGALFTLIESLHRKKIGVIGHSLGGQIAVRLISERPELFRFAVFLSAWVNPKPKTVQAYCALSGLAVKMLHWRRLVHLQGKYWNYTAEQTNRMAEYSKQITSRVYRSFFTNTLDLSKLSAYQAASIPMLAICGDKEGKDMKASLKLLAANPCCNAIRLHGANHSFPMRNAKELNPVLEKFISECV